MPARKPGYIPLRERWAWASCSEDEDDKEVTQPPPSSEVSGSAKRPKRQAAERAITNMSGGGQPSQSGRSSSDDAGRLSRTQTSRGWPRGDSFTVCHHCRMRTNILVISCTYQTCRKKNFCARCLTQHYEGLPKRIPIPRTKSLLVQSCPYCEDLCTCSRCKVRQTSTASMDTPPPTTSSSARYASSTARAVRLGGTPKGTVNQTSVSRSSEEYSSIPAPMTVSNAEHSDAVKRIAFRPVYAQYSHEKETTPSAMWASKSTRKRKRDENVTAPNSDYGVPEVMAEDTASAKWTCPTPQNARPAKPARPNYIVIESSPEPEEPPYRPPPPPPLPACPPSDEPAPYEYISGVSAMCTTLSLRGRLIELVRSPEYVQRLRDGDAKEEAGNLKRHFVDIWADQEQAGDLEFSWFKKHGATLKLKGTFGTDVLMTSDPRALQHILHTSTYRFEKSPEIILTGIALTGTKGILNADGKTHQRLRRLLGPAFSESQLRAAIPLFQRVGKDLANKMMADLGRLGKVLDMRHYFGKATLEAIGETTFAHKFNAIEDEDCEMGKIMAHFMDDASSMTKSMRVLLWFFEKVPALQTLMAYSPSDMHLRLLQFQEITKKLAKRIVDEAKGQHTIDDGAKDIMSIFVRANQSEDPKRKLTEEEVLSQSASIISAGQETTSSTLTWMFYELSKRQDIQDAVREEILDTRKRLGDSPLTAQDTDGMKMLNAETLRFHPILGAVSRQAQFDEVIPLSEPIVTTDGHIIDRIPVKKGQLIECALHGYNRNPAVWGRDAHLWRPERWEKKPDSQIDVGMYSNILSFSGGVRSCIGWRFAVLEMQNFATIMLENFRFEMSEGSKDIRRRPGLFITPRIANRFDEGLQMPLQVTPL
ncbi:cytochrome P450 [Cylindrobasidium torrendii FP15055 ss-10]|uniref:Cytochrome P450 n=1 Tax=Cylindrobasidium torrendii FP15055 ss-10 TaxID=1314674 RepID=A0A0D7B8A8_9AGAR|nr:cytochrome P450 [Cylindrobasidium torrendii FP15055 ss-10]